MKSIKVKILGPVAVLAVLVLVTSAFSILGAYYDCRSSVTV